MNYLTKILYILIFIFSSFCKLNAQSISIASGLGTSFFGLGGNIAVDLNDRTTPSCFKLSGSIGNIQIPSQSFIFNGVSVTGSAAIKSGGIGVFYDLHPFNNAFKITTGLFYSRFEFNGNLVVNDTYNLGEIKLSPEEVGSAELRIKPSQLIPYLGIGIGRSIPNSKRISFSFELGTFYSTKNNVALNCTGLIEPMSEQQSIIEANLSNYQWIPNTSLTLNFRLK